MITDPKILSAIAGMAWQIKPPTGVEIHKGALLAALTYTESSWGRDQFLLKTEKAYMPGGYYYERSAAVRKIWQKYREAGAASWGAWHILYPTATELGFRGHPWELVEPFIGLKYVIAYLNRRTFRKWSKSQTPRLVSAARTLEDVADSYNSGTQHDANIPHAYIKKFVEGYEEALRYYTEK